MGAYKKKKVIKIKRLEFMISALSNMNKQNIIIIIKKKPKPTKNSLNEITQLKVNQETL